MLVHLKKFEETLVGIGLPTPIIQMSLGFAAGIKTMILIRLILI